MSPDFWNERYRAQPFSYGEAPNAFLAACAGLLPAEGRALVPGDGQGRNGVWLAKQGLRPLCVDYSDVAIEQARAFAEREGVAIDTETGDFLQADLPAGGFALAASIYFHLPPDLREPGHRRIVEALAPGGRLIVELFAKGQCEYQEKYGSGGPPNPAMHIDEATLLADFRGLRPLYLETAEIVLHESPFHEGLARVIRAVLEKPE